MMNKATFAGDEHQLLPQAPAPSAPTHQVSRRTVVRAALGLTGLLAAAPLVAGAAPMGAPAQGPTGSVSATEIVVGMSAAFKGSSRGLGIELYRGAMAYLEHVNRAGGVHGRQIVIKSYDDSYMPLPAVDNTITLIERDDVFLLWNYVGTPTVTRMLPLLKRYSDQQMLLFFPFSGAQAMREAPYTSSVFNLRASYREETAGLVENLVALGHKRIAVFYQADAYGRSGWDGVRRALATQKLTMVGEATYRRGTEFSASMQQQVDLLKAAQPDAIIAIGAYAACAAFIRDARDADWQVPIANVSFVGSESLLKLLQDTTTTTGTSYTAHLINSQVVPSYEDESLPAVREYKELMDRYTPLPPQTLIDADYQPVPYSFVSFEGFLNAKLLVEMLKQMGTTPQRERIAATMEGLRNIDLGIKVPITFGPDRHQGLSAVYYTTVQDDRWVPITNWKEQVQ